MNECLGVLRYIILTKIPAFNINSVSKSWDLANQEGRLEMSFKLRGVSVTIWPLPKGGAWRNRWTASCHCCRAVGLEFGICLKSGRSPSNSKAMSVHNSVIVLTGTFMSVGGRSRWDRSNPTQYGGSGLVRSGHVRSNPIWSGWSALLVGRVWSGPIQFNLVWLVDRSKSINQYWWARVERWELLL